MSTLLILPCTFSGVFRGDARAVVPSAVESAVAVEPVESTNGVDPEIEVGPGDGVDP